ncbi:ribosomal RNA small subunit methyltransferase [Streptomyces viridochromogenes DSM 40736]|uniref:Ribosomal RNA small subunit methyltransferase n=1 Tax=Streptomyces viridochromogenes (strain DSM 40736 / JCM 4977 / BCRC 1201 / Tue 494) TaxID=591159 RepID=D9XAM9_STRVT|nr:ribosomal RNA small subunit methyltransferase [Streptomyces viridochromogenes DSM 40736]
MDDRMTTPWGELALSRFPEDPRDRLRAWDASDEYLLGHLAEERVPLSGTVVVVGDRWGALATALAAHRPAQITDSYLAREATRANLARAGAEPGAVRLLTTQDPPPERIDVLLVRVPKSLALLEDQLLRLAPAVHAGTVVVGTGMVKEIHTSTLQLFERILGPTRTSLAVKKARLIFCTPDPALERPASPWPYVYTLPDGIGPAAGGTVVNHAGVFCADRLDIRHPVLPAASAGQREWPAGGGPGLRQRRGRYGGGPEKTRRPRCCSWTSRSRRWPRRRRRTRRTGCRGTPSSGWATGWRACRPAVSTWSSTTRRSTPTRRRRTPRPGGCSPGRGARCARAVSCGWSATGIWAITSSCGGCSATVNWWRATGSSWC